MLNGRFFISANFDLFSEYYNINEYGYWENENKYVLIKILLNEN